MYGNESSSILDEQAISQVSSQLATLGFKETQVKKAALFLSQPTPLLAKFLESSSLLEAATEYLLLYTPECDLPPRFLPSANSSNSFVSSVHSGTSDVKKRWVEDKAVKEAGWPIHVVQEYTTDPAILGDWTLLVVKLGKRLLGMRDGDDELELPPFSFDEDELQSLGAELRDTGHYALPSFTAPVTLHIFFDASRQYPRPYYAPMFITSKEVPPYMRLHILSRILSTLYRLSDPEESEETFGMTLMRVIDEEWARIEDEGPPNVADVMAHMLPERKTKVEASIPATPKIVKNQTQPENRTLHTPRTLPKKEAKVSHPRNVGIDILILLF